MVQERQPDAEGTITFIFEDVPTDREADLLCEALDSGGVYARSQTTQTFSPGPNSVPLVLLPSDPINIPVGFGDAIPTLPANTTGIYRVTAPKDGDWTLYLSGAYPESVAWGPDGRVIPSYQHASGILSLPGLRAGQSAYLGLWAGDAGHALSSHFIRAPQGALDASFGAGGKTTALGDVLITDENINDMIELDANRVAVVGSYRPTYSSGIDVAFIAVFENGELDMHFNADDTPGWKQLDWTGLDRSEACACALQTVGTMTRIIVASRYWASGSYSTYLSRVNLDGTLDGSFGVNGYYNFGISNANWDYCLPPDIAIGSNGEIFVCYNPLSTANFSIGVFGVLADGSGLNSGFASSGLFQTASMDYRPTSIALNNGYLYIASYSGTAFNITRIAENGAKPIMAFGNSAFISGMPNDTLQITNAEYADYATGTLEASDASGEELLYLTGSRARQFGNGHQELSLGVYRASNGNARYASGLFDSGGVWTPDLGYAGDLHAFDILVDPVSGDMTVCGGGAAAVAVKILHNGGNPVLDGSGFNSNGSVRFFDSATCLSAAVRLQSGALAFGGHKVVGANDRDLFLTERLPSGASARADWSKGLVRETCVFNDVVVQRDGRILAVGDMGDYKGIVARFLSDGRLDTSFNQNGVRVFTLSGTNSIRFNAAAIGPDGDIIIAGENTTGGIRGCLVHLRGTDGSDGPRWSMYDHFSPSTFDSIVIDGEGYAYVGGVYSGQPTIISFDTSGLMKETRTFGYSTNPTVRDMVIGPDNTLHFLSEGDNETVYSTISVASGAFVSVRIIRDTISGGANARIALDADGLAYIVATIIDNDECRPLVAKYDSAHSRIWQNSATPLNSYSSVYGIALHPDGRIFVSGTMDPGSERLRSYVMAFDQSGTIILGMNVTAIPNSESILNQCNAMALTPSGNIVLAGKVKNTETPAALFLFE